MGKPSNHFVGHTFLSRLVEKKKIIKLLDTAHRNILTRRHLVPHEVLKNNADFPVEVLEVVLSKIDTIQQHLPFDGIVKAGEQLDDGCFALTIFSDQCDPLARVKLKVQSIQNQA